MTIRFAVVGVQGYSRIHLAGVQSLTEQGRGRLAASMLIDQADHPDMVAELEKNGTQVFDDYQTMLDACQGQVDIVTLPVPIHLHAAMSIAALNAGYHVLVEKPVTGASLPQVDELIAARDAAHRHCAVGFQALYSPLFQKLKQLIAAGELGKVQRIHGMALWPRNPSYYTRNNWAGKLTCDGQPVFDSPFNNAVAHQIMNLLFLASPVPGQAAYAGQIEAELFRAYAIESFDTGCLRARTASGVDLYFAASHACQTTVNPIIRLEAENAVVSYGYLQPQATIAYRDGRTEIVKDSEAARNDLFNNLADVLTGQAAEPFCTLEIARAHVACTDAVHRAAQIADVPTGLVSEIEGGQRVIQDIDQVIQQGFETGQLFSELGAPFAAL